MRQWRQGHPGYWKRPAKAPGTLQDVLPFQAADNVSLAKTTSPAPLQDFVASQDPLLLGLISHLIDSPLQEVVEQTTLRLLQKGRDLLDMRFGMKSKGNTYADKFKLATGLFLGKLKSSFSKKLAAVYKVSIQNSGRWIF